MNMNTQKFAATVIAGIIFSIPLFVYSAGLVPCGGPNEPACDFNQLIVMVNTIIHFLMYIVAVPLAARGFMWVGGNLILSQDKASAWSTAKERFWDIGKGFAIMIGAFLLIKFILSQFLADGFSVNFILN